MQIDLWRFANRLYAAPNVKQMCLMAQAQGANVCLMLCGLWLEWQPKAYSAELAATLKQCAAQDERVIIEPLRSLRTQWKSQAAQDPALTQLREAVKQLELTAEKTLLAKLEALCAELATGQANGDWLAALSLPVVWQEQELRQWQQLLASA